MGENISVNGWTVSRMLKSSRHMRWIFPEGMKVNVDLFKELGQVTFMVEFEWIKLKTQFQGREKKKV